jgi:hypothetical protein
VIGAVTGRPYRFARSGARLTVAAADAGSLLRVPGLRPVGRS